MIIKFDEAALHKAFGPTFVEGMRHIVRQLGALTEQTTLPEVAALTDTLTPVVNSLVLTVTATNAAVAVLEVEQAIAPYSDADIVRRLDEMQAELELVRSDRAALARAVTEMQDQFGVNEQSSTLGSIGAAAVDGSATQDFNTAALTASGAVSLSPASANVVLSPTGTGLVTISPATLGSLDNVAIGGATKAAGGFTTVATTDNISVTRATGVPKITATATTGTNEAYLQFINTGGGYYFGVENSAGGWFGATAYAGVVSAPAGKVIQQMVGGTASTTTSGTGLIVAGGFGCNTKGEQGAYALGAAATDLATVITLANNLRTMAINNGMGS